LLDRGFKGFWTHFYPLVWEKTLSFNVLGFYLSSFLLMVLLLKAVKPTRWWIAIMSGVIAVLISYALFKVWLDVPFPGGILGF